MHFVPIYFHKTSRAVQIMLGEAIRKLSEDINLVEYNSPEEYLQWDDLVFVLRIIAQ